MNSNFPFDNTLKFGIDNLLDIQPGSEYVPLPPPLTGLFLEFQGTNQPFLLLSGADLELL